jgi:4-hydroxy-2-oxoheptanedioate aldolase
VSRSDDLRSVLRGDRAAVGLWASIPSSLTAEVAAATGADYVVVDQQHGAVDPAEMVAMLQGIAAGGSVGLVRVARNDPWVIGNALDLGAAGVIVPMVDDGAAAARAVSACRYAPDGERSFGTVRGAADPTPVCLVMIETRAGLEHVEEIVSTPGLDGVYIGPSDLALSLGLQPTLTIEHAAVLDAIEEIRAACHRAGVLVGVHCLQGEDAARYVTRGFALVTAGGDVHHLRDALRDALASARLGASSGADDEPVA